MAYGRVFDFPETGEGDLTRIRGDDVPFLQRDGY